MSGAAQGSSATTKATVSDSKNGEQPQAQDKKPAAQLEEDDEFEDFPVEGKFTSVRIHAGHWTGTHLHVFREHSLTST